MAHLSRDICVLAQAGVLATWRGTHSIGICFWWAMQLVSDYVRQMVTDKRIMIDEWFIMTFRMPLSSFAPRPLRACPADGSPLGVVAALPSPIHSASAPAPSSTRQVLAEDDGLAFARSSSASARLAGLYKPFPLTKGLLPHLLLEFHERSVDV